MKAIYRGVLLACFSFIVVWAVIAALLWLRSSAETPPQPPGQVVVGESAPSRSVSPAPEPSPPQSVEATKDDVVAPPPAVTDDDDDDDDDDDGDDDDD